MSHSKSRRWWIWAVVSTTLFLVALMTTEMFYMEALPSMPSSDIGTSPEINADRDKAFRDRSQGGGGGGGRASAFEVVGHTIDRAIRGSAAVSAPDVVKVDDEFEVVLRISPEHLGSLIEGLRADFSKNATVQGQTDVRLLPRMTAELQGSGFSVRPEAARMQAVSATEPTDWRWELKALESGRKTLLVDLSGWLDIEGRDTPRRFSTLYQEIHVNVRPVDPVAFAKENWQWLASSLVLPAIGALWALRRKPKDAAGKSQPSALERIRARRLGRR